MHYDELAKMTHFDVGVPADGHAQGELGLSAPLQGWIFIQARLFLFLGEMHVSPTECHIHQACTSDGVPRYHVSILI